jgi:hypothetical protein
MKLRIVTGALLLVVGLAALLYGAAFVKGPLLFWLDPFQADRIQLQAFVVGIAALILGAVTFASARWKAGRA